MWTEEEENFWVENSLLLVRIQESFRAVSKGFNSSMVSRKYLEIFYKTETGKQPINFPYEYLLLFWITKHNEAVQAVRDLAITNKKYEAWLNSGANFDKTLDTVEGFLSYVPFIVGGVALIMLLNLVKD